MKRICEIFRELFKKYREGENKVVSLCEFHVIFLEII